MSGDDPNLAHSMRMAVAMLATAIPTVEDGQHAPADRRVWADALDQLARELRADEQVVIRGEVQS